MERGEWEHGANKRIPRQCKYDPKRQSKIVAFLGYSVTICVYWYYVLNYSNILLATVVLPFALFCKEGGPAGPGDLFPRRAIGSCCSCSHHQVNIYYFYGCLNRIGRIWHYVESYSGYYINCKRRTGYNGINDNGEIPRTPVEARHASSLRGMPCLYH